MIDTDLITGVLLADRWHDVQAGTSRSPATSTADGGQAARPPPDQAKRVTVPARLTVLDTDGAGICPRAFAFDAPDGARYLGPLTSILAVREQDEDES